MKLATFLSLFSISLFSQTAFIGEVKSINDKSIFIPKLVFDIQKETMVLFQNNLFNESIEKVYPLFKNYELVFKLMAPITNLEYHDGFVCIFPVDRQKLNLDFASTEKLFFKNISPTRKEIILSEFLIWYSKQEYGREFVDINYKSTKEILDKAKITICAITILRKTESILIWMYNELKYGELNKSVHMRNKAGEWKTVGYLCFSCD